MGTGKTAESVEGITGEFPYFLSAYAIYRRQIIKYAQVKTVTNTCTQIKDKIMQLRE
jgi:hypothetical protein